MKGFFKRESKNEVKEDINVVRNSLTEKKSFTRRLSLPTQSKNSVDQTRLERRSSFKRNDETNKKCIIL